MDINLKVEILEKLNYALYKVSPSHFRWIGTATNLKMHDAFSYANESDNEDLFERWCEDSFQEEYLPKLDELDVSEEAIGLSSSFRLKPNNTELLCLYGLHSYENSSEEEKRLMAFEEFIYSRFSYFTFESDDFKNDHIVTTKSIENEVYYQMERYEITIDECLEEMGFLNLTKKELAHEFETFCKEELKDLNRMYDFLENFSENQVQYFKDFINEMY